MLTAVQARPYGRSPIRPRRLQELLRAATALPSAPGSETPQSSTAASTLTQIAQLDDGRGRAAPGAPDGADAEAELDEETTTAVRTQIATLRRLVHDVLVTLSTRVDAALAPALARAFQAWDRADDLTIMDVGLQDRLAEERWRLEAALGSPHRHVRAVALEAILTLRAACGLVELVERRLSPLIRLRVRSDERELLPGGRPFLDLGAALAEVAREWR